MSENTNEQAALLPPVDVCEDPGGITLFADLPGVPRDKLNVHVDGDTLVIEGEMAIEAPRDMESTHLEVGVPRYRRVFTLSKELDPDSMSAELKQGVLRLRIEKSAKAKPRRITIETS